MFSKCCVMTNQTKQDNELCTLYRGWLIQLEIDIGNNDVATFGLRYTTGILDKYREKGGVGFQGFEDKIMKKQFEYGDFKGYNETFTIKRRYSGITLDDRELMMDRMIVWKLPKIPYDSDILILYIINCIVVVIGEKRKGTYIENNPGLKALDKKVHSEIGNRYEMLYEYLCIKNGFGSIEIITVIKNMIIEFFDPNPMMY